MSSVCVLLFLNRGKSQCDLLNSEPFITFFSPNILCKPHFYWGFPGGSAVKKLPTNTEDAGLISGPGISPGEGNGNPLQYCYPGNPMNRGAWKAMIHRSQRVRHHSNGVGRLLWSPKWTRDPEQWGQRDTPPCISQCRPRCPDLILDHLGHNDFLESPAKWDVLLPPND